MLRTCMRARTAGCEVQLSSSFATCTVYAHVQTTAYAPCEKNLQHNGAGPCYPGCPQQLQTDPIRPGDVIELKRWDESNCRAKPGRVTNVPSA